MAVDLGSTFKELIDEINSKSDGKVDSELSNTSTNAVQNKVVKAALDGKQASGNYVKYTTHSGVTAGKKTNVTIYSYQQSPVVVSNGMIIGGTAQDAGLVTRGICGATTPDASTGACTTDNLYVNYDGDRKYSRYMVLGAGDTGADITTSTKKTKYAAKKYGTLMSAIRGDQMVNYVTDKLANVPTANEISEIKAAVAGKAKSYILSYNDSFTNGREGATWYDKDGNDITSSIGTGSYTTCSNDMFNLASTDPLDPNIQGGQIIIRIFDETGTVTSGYNYLVLSIDTGGGLNVGDNIYVIETDVPDRWYAGNHRFYALESKLIGYASLSGNNTFTGNNSFKDKIQVVNPNYVPTTYKYDGITTVEGYNLTFPSKSGAIALTSDIPSTSNLVTTNTAQTISGTKTFNAPTDVSGHETITTKFKTSNGGALIIGKEGQNSGTMLRFDQVDGTCRLRFRSSATPGSMVWSQPEKNAVLYFDMGNSSGSGVNRVTLRNVAGTLALTKELPAAVSANPALSGSEAYLTGLQIGSTKYKIPSGGGGGGSCTLDDLEAVYKEDIENGDIDNVNAVPVLDVENTGYWTMVPVSELGGGGGGGKKYYNHFVTITEMANNGRNDIYLNIVSTSNTAFTKNNIYLRLNSYQFCVYTATKYSPSSMKIYPAYIQVCTPTQLSVGLFDSNSISIMLSSAGLTDSITLISDL